ncbi:MAG: hypothetical protein IIY80_01095 [Aeriscardovia sp.]|nr:hypothetical protein [Aeriscardovia sp.]
MEDDPVSLLPFAFPFGHFKREGKGIIFTPSASFCYSDATLAYATASLLNGGFDIAHTNGSTPFSQWLNAHEFDFYHWRIDDKAACVLRMAWLFASLVIDLPVRFDFLEDGGTLVTFAEGKTGRLQMDSDIAYGIVQLLIGIVQPSC